MKNNYENIIDSITYESLVFYRQCLIDTQEQVYRLFTLSKENGDEEMVRIYTEIVRMIF